MVQQSLHPIGIQDLVAVAKHPFELGSGADLITAPLLQQFRRCRVGFGDGRVGSEGLRRRCGPIAGRAEQTDRWHLGEASLKQTLRDRVGSQRFRAHQSQFRASVAMALHLLLQAGCNLLHAIGGVLRLAFEDQHFGVRRSAGHQFLPALYGWVNHDQAGGCLRRWQLTPEGIGGLVQQGRAGFSQALVGALGIEVPERFRVGGQDVLIHELPGPLQRTVAANGLAVAAGAVVENCRFGERGLEGVVELAVVVAACRKRLWLEGIHHHRTHTISFNHPRLG